MDRPFSNASALQAIAPVLAQALRQCGLGHVVLLERLVRYWDTIAGPQLAAVTQPESIRARVLFITVRDAIWLQQITFYQAQLLENIRNVLGDVSITRLHFLLAMSSSRQPGPASTEAELEPVPLTAVEEQQMQDGTARIADPDLREAVRRAWRQGWQARRSGV
jgi:predicted nucleic acid-binding Zn ribbon protein